MFVTNELAASGFGFHWTPGEVVEVPDDVAAELVSIQDAGFTIAPQPVPSAHKKAAPKRKTNTEVEDTHVDTTDL